jgi:signal peptidase II
MKARIASFALSAVIVVLDQASKIWIRNNVSDWDRLEIVPGFFRIIHTENRGAAFGVLAEASSEWRTFFLIGLSMLVMVLIGALLWQPSRGGLADTSLLRTGLSLILGGAVGNLYDRIALGGVTDFLEFYRGAWAFPAFNVADSAISVGAGLLILDLWRHRKKELA